jgi:hypothetical protein
MAMFEQLQSGDLLLFILIFGVIILLPKKRDAYRIEEYRLICLLNVSLKFFTKFCTNRVMGIAKSVV